MKNILLSFLFITIGQLVFSQSTWMVKSDAKPNCSLIKSGKFLNMETEEKAMLGYYMLFDGDTVTEVINDKYYLKSKIVFTSECAYTSTVVEVTIPNYNLGVGTIIHTEIVATDTSANLLKIKSSLGDKSYYFVLKKVDW